MTAPFITILGIDQSTDQTGVVLARCGETIHILRHATLTSSAKGNDLQARIARLRDHRRQLADFVVSVSRSACPDTIDLIAYEQPFVGPAAKANWDALPMALGAFLTLSTLSGIPIVAVSRQAACKEAGCSMLYQRRVTTAREREDKRQELKAAVIGWANSLFALHLADDEDGIADAAAVAVAAYRQYQAAEEAKRNTIRPLMGKGSRGPRKAVAA